MKNNVFKLLVFGFIIIFNIRTVNIKSQNKSYIDSLEHNLSEIIKAEQNDSILNNRFKEVFYYYESSEWGISVEIANKAISTYKERKDTKYCSFWYNSLGFLYQRHDVYPLALETYYNGLKAAKKNSINKGKCYNNIARVYLAQNIDINEAQRITLKAIEEQKLIEDKVIKNKELAYSYNQLGVVFERKNDLPKAIELYKKAYGIRIKMNDTVGLVNSIFTIAYYYNFINEADSSLFYYSKGLKLNKTSSYQISYLVNRALVYAKKNMFAKAQVDIDLALITAKDNSKLEIAKVLKHQSQIENIKRNLSNAVKFAISAINEAEKYNQSKIKFELYEMLIGFYKESQNYNKVQYYQSEYINLLNKKDAEKYDVIQRNISNRGNNTINVLEIENETLENLTERQRLLIISILSLFVLSLILFFFFIKNRKKLAVVSDEIFTQATIARILGNISGTQRSMEKFLQDSLEIILDVPWLKFETKGSIFLTNKDGNLKMLAHKNLGAPLLKMCAIVKPGQCLCGKALKEKKVIFCNHISEKHNLKPDGMTPHGHYNIPLFFHDKVLGVLNLYLKHGHKKSESEIEFLETICKTISSVVNRKAIQKDVRTQALEQEKLNQQMFAQKLELEQRNNEIEQISKEQQKLNQQMFAQKLEVEQRNNEIEQISKEQEKTNQKLFAQKLEVEQRNAEVEKISKEQQKTNQKLFAQKLELEQRNIEVEKYSKEQDKLNQKFFAQTLELDQRNIEINSYSNKLEKQKKEIEETHKNLTDSINYAETIQSALLPKKKQLSTILDDYFIIFKPKQVVSGDFYYATKVDNHIVFAVADCTGHGVPGGFLTMLGITYISEIVHKKEIKTPADTLEALRSNIKGIFAEFGSKNSNGFDIALCAIDSNTNILTFSGAFNSLYLVRNGELKEYKAVSNPIGWYPKEVDFVNEKIQLQNDDLIYLFSDGYSDQFGLKKRKFLKKRFKMLLLEIKDMTMDEQQNVLDGIFEKWKENEDQTDDVTVMGVRWKM